MKILYVSKYAAFGNSPKPTRQYFIARALADQGCEVTLVGSRSNGVSSPPFLGVSRRWSEGRLTNVLLNGPIVGFGMNARRLVSWLLFELLLLLQLPRFWRMKPDVLIVSSLSALTLWTGVILKRLLRIPLVVEIRDIYPLTLIEIGGFGVRNSFVRLLGAIERLAYRQADLLISPLEKCDVHAASVAGVAPPFLWLPMGADLSFGDCEAGSRGHVAIDQLKALKRQGKFLVVYAGTIGAANALDVVFEAATANIPGSVHFVFVGDGPRKAELLRAHGHLSNVTFLPAIPKADVVGVIAQADLLINTWKDAPIYRFGVSPNKWIDYGLSGRPFLTNLQPKLEVVHLAGNAFVTEDASSAALARAITLISAMPEAELDRMGAAGRKYVIDNLSYSSLAVKLLAGLRTVIAPA